jgi:hypothetical protein
MFEIGDGNIVIHPGLSSGSMCLSGWGVGKVRGDASRIDEIREFAGHGEGFGFPDVIVDEVN